MKLAEGKSSSSNKLQFRRYKQKQIREVHETNKGAALTKNNGVNHPILFMVKIEMNVINERNMNIIFRNNQANPLPHIIYIDFSWIKAIRDSVICLSGLSVFISRRLL